MLLLRETWVSVRTLDWSMVTIWKGLRVFCILFAIQAWALTTGHVHIGVSMTIGAVFVGGILDLNDSYRHRIFSMGVGAFALAFSVFLGGLVSSNQLAHVVVMALFAFVCGFAVLGGPRTGMIGVLCLVMYCVYSGMPLLFTSAWGDALGYFVGSMISATVVVVPWLFRRLDGHREILAGFFRGFGYVCKSDPSQAINAVHAERLRTLSLAMEFDGHEGSSREWIDEIARRASVIRFNTIALSKELEVVDDPEIRAGMAAYFSAMNALCRSLSRALRWKWAARSLPMNVVELSKATEACQGFGPAIQVSILQSNTAYLEEVAELVGHPWPLGKTNGVHLPKIRMPKSGAILSHLRWSDESFRHAVRLSFAITVAALIALHWGNDRGYWLPMTVAWVAKPGQGDTSVRVLARIAGTCGGVLLSLGLFELLHPTSWFEIVLIALCGALTPVFLLSNYAFAIVWWSMFVIFLLGSAGSPIDELAPLRALWTIGAGVIVIALSFFWPARRSGNVCSSLCDSVQSLAAYAQALLSRTESSQEEIDQTRTIVIEKRVKAAAIIDASAHEPGAHRLEVRDARTILDGLNKVAAELLDNELRQDFSGQRVTLIRDQLAELEDRIRELDHEGYTSPRIVTDRAQPGAVDGVHEVLNHYSTPVP